MSWRAPKMEHDIEFKSIWVHTGFQVTPSKSQPVLISLKARIYHSHDPCCSKEDEPSQSIKPQPRDQLSVFLSQSWISELVTLSGKAGAKAGAITLFTFSIRSLGTLEAKNDWVSILSNDLQWSWWFQSKCKTWKDASLNHDIFHQVLTIYGHGLGTGQYSNRARLFHRRLFPIAGSCHREGPERQQGRAHGTGTLLASTPYNLSLPLIILSILDMESGA